MRLLLPIAVLLAVALGCTESRPPKEYKNKRPVVTETVELGPKQWHRWPFTVSERGARINGSYDTAEGVDHEIIFYVVDPANVDSIQKNDTGSYYFRSLDSRTRQHMNGVLRNLDPGEYYLLFQNESDSAPHKTRVRMYLEW